MGYKQLKQFMKKAHQNKKTQISSFVVKLQMLLGEHQSAEAIKWNLQGDAITIDRHNELLETILGTHFNHANFSSFIRQLNLYGFRKVSEKDSFMQYKNNNFLRQKTYLHHLVRRKKRTPKQEKINNFLLNSSTNSVVEKSESAMKQLIDIHFRVKNDNLRITKEINSLKKNLSLLSNIKQSQFYNDIKGYDNSLKSKKTTSTDHQPNNITNSPIERTFQKQNQEFEVGDFSNFTSEQEIRQQYCKSQQNLDDFSNQYQNIQIEMNEASIQQLSCNQMRQQNDHEDNFWNGEKMKPDCCQFD